MATADEEEKRYTLEEIVRWMHNDLHILSDRNAAYLLTLPVGSKNPPDPDQEARERALSVVCPRCRSGVGIRCYDGVAPKEYPHTIRVTSALERERH